jgi:diaminopimelate decarboxylase
MHHFRVVADDLCCEDVALEAVAREIGTPVYVYSRATIERHLRVFDDALAGRPHRICYSVKANSNLAILRLLAGLGAGMDVVSGGELHRALRAGVAADRILFGGVGKREDEIEAALRAGILMINVESLQELDLCDRVAARLGTKAPISIRVNPDVDAETHPHISTGLRKNKFGVPAARAREAYHRAASLPHLAVRGVDCHIGSQLTRLDPLRDAIGRVAELARELRDGGAPLEFLDVGGGLGIPYRDEDAPPSPADYGRMLDEALAPFSGLDLTLLCEPGRVIVGNAGVLLTRVLYVKEGEEKAFVVVDAAMNDLVRPALYGSHHEIRHVRERDRAPLVADVVGPICESSDHFARDRALGRPEPGELLAVMSAGAYGFSMASTYNTRPRPAEVMCDGARYDVIRRRETLEDLLRAET